MAHNSINLEMERMLPSLEFYIAAQILTKEEVRDIISARSEFEYKLHSTAPLLRHYIAAIEYECQLHRILHDREACVGHTEHKFRRSTLSRIQRLYRRGIRAFRKNSENEQSMIQHYLQFLSRMDPIQGNRAERPDKPMKAKKISQFLAQRITSHPTDANLWTAEAHVDASTYGDISRVRNILNRALRIVPESLCIHRERCRGELDYLAKLMTVARDELDEASRRRVYNDTFKKLICIPMCLVEGLVDSRLQSTPDRRKRLHSDPASTVDKSENISDKIGRTDLKFSDLRQTFLEPIQQYVWAELEILLPVYSLFFENFPLDCFQDFVHYVLTRHSSLHATNATSPECSFQLEGNSLERFLFSDESKKQNDCVEQQLDTYQDLDTDQSSPLVRLLLPMRSASIEILKLSATYVVLVPSSPVAWNNFLHVLLLSATNYPISELDNVTKILSLVTKNTSSRANLAVTPRDLDALNKVFQRQFHNLGGDQGYTKILNSLEADAEAYHCAQMPCTSLEAQNGLSHDALYQVVEKLLRLDSKTLCTSWNSVPSPHSEEHRAIFQNFLQSLLTQLCTGARDLLRPGGMAICALALHALKCDNAQAPHTSSPVMGIEEAFALFRGEGNTGDAKTVKRGMGKIDTEEASTCATLLWSIYRILTFHKASWDPSSLHERRVVGASSSPGGNMVGSTNTGRALLGENTTAHESETRSVWLSMKGEWEHFRHEVVSFMRLCNPRSRPELFTCFTKVYVWCSTVLKSLGPISHSNACSTLFDDCVLEEKNYVLPCDTYDFLLDPTTRIELNIPPEVARKWFEGWIRSVETCEDALKAWIAYMKFEQEQSLYLGEGKAPNVQDLYGRAKEHFKEIIKQSSLCSSVLLEKSEKGKGSSSRHDDANPMSQLHFAYQRILQ